MRVAIVSDIHGNLRAFRAVLADLRQVTPDIVVHGGDLAYGGTHAAEIIDQVRSLGWPGVRGNTDEMLWAPESLAAFAATAPKLAPLLAILQELIPPTLASIGRERLRWLQGLPFLYSQQGFTLVHASPNDLWRAPMPDASDDELQSTYASVCAQIVVYGHIHRPYIRRLSGLTVANREASANPMTEIDAHPMWCLTGRASPFAESNTTSKVKRKNSCVRAYRMLTGCLGFCSPDSTVPHEGVLIRLSSSIVSRDARRGFYSFAHNVVAPKYNPAESNE